MPLLIDGYNVYHAALKFSSEWSRLVPMGLCRLVAQDMCRLGEAAVVVFDWPEPRGQFLKVEPEGYVRIIYAGPGRDADSALEKLIKDNSAPRRLTVVSSDRQVQRAARRRRARILKADEYLEALQMRSEQPPDRPQEPIEKRRGVAEGDLTEWLELFGIDPDEPPDELGPIRF